MAPPRKKTMASKKALLVKPTKIKPNATTKELKKMLLSKPEKKRKPSASANKASRPRVSLEPAQTTAVLPKIALKEGVKQSHSNIFGTVKNTKLLNCLLPKKRPRPDDSLSNPPTKLTAKKRPTKNGTTPNSSTEVSSTLLSASSGQKRQLRVNDTTTLSHEAATKNQNPTTIPPKSVTNNVLLDESKNAQPVLSLSLLASRRERKSRIIQRQRLQQLSTSNLVVSLPSPTKPSQPDDPNERAKPAINDNITEQPEHERKQSLAGEQLDSPKKDCAVHALASTKPIAAAQHIPKSEDNRKHDIAKKLPPKANYVRQNLRNKAGACRGARNKARMSKSKQRWEERRKEFRQNMDAKRNENALFASDSQAVANTKHGVDPVDDYVDGVFTANVKKQKGKTIPKCSEHQQPCKLLTVKKSGQNKGRPFYACSLPRDQQCNHFEWADDTVQAAQAALLKNKSVSGFIARQTASYMEQIKCLTVPELKDLAKRHRLRATGKKADLKTRLTIWVRDEIASSVKEEDMSSDKTSASDRAKKDCAEEQPEESSASGSDSDSCSSSDDELELVGDRPLAISETPPEDKEGFDVEVENDDSASTIVDTAAGGCASTLTMLRKLFGYSSFREGQDWAIQRCLNNQRSLLVAPTGFGKSLCFALPAAMMKGICIVVSPLLSLIQDQIRMLPARLPAVTLSGALSNAKMAATLDDIVRGRIKILFVSPERLASASFRRLFRPKWNSETNSYERMFPEVSLLCVDEAHCLSQWSHNFRPCYLRLRSILAKMIQPRSVLAITATAGPSVAHDICRTLQIPDCDGMKISKTDRDNIDVKCLFLDSQEERLAKLISILGKRDKKDEDGARHFTGCLATGSVIVYVWRKRDAEVVAENIQAAGISGGVVFYHGGMTSETRTKVQSLFMRGKARICVATIAFGLGINKADVAGVVHMYCSSSPEHYVQEIGRAGRNGKPARAIALILNDEVLIRHSLAHSDLISRSQIAVLLSFLKTQVVRTVELLPSERSADQPIHVALPVAMAVLGCDCKVETTETIASLLEQRDGDNELLLGIEGITYDAFTVAPRRRRLEQLAESEPIAKALLHCGECVESPAGADAPTRDGRENSTGNSNLVGGVFGAYTCSVAYCANYLGENAEPRHVFAALRRLEAAGEIDMALDTAPKDRVLGLLITQVGREYFQDRSGDKINSLVDELQGKLHATVSSNCIKTIDMNYIMKQVSQVDDDAHSGNKSTSLLEFQSLMSAYFEAEGRGLSLSTVAQTVEFGTDVNAIELSRDVQQAIAYLRELQTAAAGTQMLQLGDISTSDYTALVVTKFLHGIAPAFVPLSTIRNHYLFGRMQRFEFSTLNKAIETLLRPRQT